MFNPQSTASTDPWGCTRVDEGWTPAMISEKPCYAAHPSCNCSHPNPKKGPWPMLNVEQLESGSTLESMCRKLWPTYRTSKSLRIKSVEYLRLLRIKYAWEVPFKKSKGPTDHWVQHHDHDFGILWAYTRASWHHEPFLCSTSSGRCLTACWNLIQDSSSAGRSEKSLAYSARSPAVRSDDSFLSCAEAISTTENSQHAVAKSVKSVRIQSVTSWSFIQHHNMLKSELK